MAIVKTLELDFEKAVEDAYHDAVINDQLIQSKIYADKGNFQLGRAYYRRTKEIVKKGVFWSVTTIIENTIDKGYGFAKWLGDSPSHQHAMDYADKAATVGNIVHALVMFLIWGEEVDTSKGFYDLRKQVKFPIGNKVKKRLMGFMQFCEDLKPELLATELSLYNEYKHNDKYRYEFAGQGDLFCRIDDKLYLIDVKTGKDYKTHALQLTAYKILWDSLYGEEHGKIDKLACLHLADTWRKKPTYKLKEYDFDPEAWYNTLDLFKWLHPVQPKFVDELPTIYELKKENKNDG